MGGHFRVVPDQLRLAAGSLEELAGRLESEVYGLRQAGANAGAAAGNGLAAGAVEGLSGAWAPALGELASALRRDAQSLGTVAARYEHADAAVEQEMRQLLGALGP